MFDGIPAGASRTRLCPYYGRPLAGPGPAPRPAEKYSRLSGAPPISEQLADQVRSGSGMTYGRTSAKTGQTVPMMPPGRAARPDPVPVADPALDRVSLPVAVPLALVTGQVRIAMMRYLTGLSATGGDLLTRTQFVHRFGNDAMKVLKVLADLGHIQLWRPAQHTAYFPEMIIRVAGASRDVRTPGAPDTVGF
jgi:hypothetical protein